MMDKFTIGLVQMNRTKNAEENLARAIEKIREAAARGAQIICIQNSFAANISAARKTPSFFDLAEADSRPRDRQALAKSPTKRKSSSSLPFSNAAPPASTTTPARCSTPTARFSANTARCTFPTIRSTTKSFISRPAIWASPISTPDTAASACRSAGTSGIRKARAWPPARRASYFLSHEHRLASRRKSGIRRRAARRLAHHPALPRHRQRRLTSPPSIASASKATGKGRPGLEFWGNSFVADPFGQVIAEASTDKEEILIVECDPAKIEEMRRNWPFLRDRRIDAYAPSSSAGSRMSLARPRPAISPNSRAPSSELGLSACPPNGSRTKPPGSAGRTNCTDWPGKFAPIPWVYADIVRHLARVERVYSARRKPRRRIARANAS